MNISSRFLLVLIPALCLPASLRAAPTFVRGPDAVSFEARLQDAADEMKRVVLEAPSNYAAAKGTRWYVSADGDDARDGRSPETAVRTLGRAAQLKPQAGDAVLFRRGDLFRGRISAAAGVTYSAYGSGAKPTICASLRDYADPALWKATAVSNVWACTERLPNVGIITFDHDPCEVGRYDVKTARMACRWGGAPGPGHLKDDLNFWCDAAGGVLYLYSAGGNPGTRFKRIEIGSHGNAIDVGKDGVTVDNLHVTLTGSHGIGAGTVRNLTVRHCVFDWLGGSLLVPEGQNGGPCRYGNAVEVYGGCDGYRVHDCWMYQIYDTGITHQCHHDKSRDIFQSNVEYARNLIEYCFWSIEYYNAYNRRGETRNVHVHHNFCRFGGDGWGCAGRADYTPMFSVDDRPDVTANYVNASNILQRSRGFLVNNFGRHASPPDFVFRGNVYVQPRGWKFANIGDRKPNVSAFDESAADVIREVFGETDGTFVFLEK